MAAHLAALAIDRVTFYTAPIKALVSEKFFALCDVFGAEHVGMLTGDASVNPGAPVLCCTAEILANIALRRGADADVGLVVMDEFHFYGEPDRGWAWQVPLLTLPLLDAGESQALLDARREPQPEQRRERRAAQAGRVGPVLHRREQEAGNHRAGKAERHLVHMPGERPAARRKGDPAQVTGRPQRHRQHGERRRAQKERPKAEPKQRQAPLSHRAPPPRGRCWPRAP